MLPEKRRKAVSIVILNACRHDFSEKTAEKRCDMDGMIRNRLEFLRASVIAEKPEAARHCSRTR